MKPCVPFCNVALIPGYGLWPVAIRNQPNSGARNSHGLHCCLVSVMLAGANNLRSELPVFKSMCTGSRLFSMYSFQCQPRRSIVQKVKYEIRA